MNVEELPEIIELNVGGVLYTTALTTLTRPDPDSLLGQWFTGSSIKDDQATVSRPVRDSKGRYFIDRDGVLFRFVLDYLRSGSITLPESFRETNRLRQEAEFYHLTDMVKALTALTSSGLKLSPSAQMARSVGGGVLTPNGEGADGIEPRESGFIVVGYRGTFQFGRDGLTDVKFRKISRILVSGRVSICREIFGESLNESRDPDRGTTDRYSARFFLKHSFIEQAFDALQEAGFRMVGACASGTNSAGDTKPGMDSEENRWNHYNEFIFCRP
jgi:hypothetical protein